MPNVSSRFPASAPLHTRAFFHTHTHTRSFSLLHTHFFLAPLPPFRWELEWGGGCGAGLGGVGLGGGVRPGGIARRAGWGRMVGSVAGPGKGWMMNPDGWGGNGWVG